MARTNQDFETRSKKHCVWSRTPSTGTTIEGLLFCVVGLYMVVTVALPLYRGAVANADTSHYKTVAAPVQHNVIASVGTDVRIPAQANVD
jgi:hypothetical protein